MSYTKVITPRRKLSLNFHELWKFRDLLFILAWRDYKVRYKETLLGALWAILQPLITMVIFVLFFGQVKEITTTGIPYPVFVYAGLLVWYFFSNSITSISLSLIGNSSLLTKVYFPRLLIPISALLVHFVDVFFSFVLLLVLMLWFGVHLQIGLILAFPFLILLTALAALGIGTFLATLAVRFRDIKFITPFFVQLTLFISPIIYSSETLGWLSTYLKLNPLTGIIDAIRFFLLDGSVVNGEELLWSIAISIVLFVLSVLYFKNKEESFSDTI